MPRYNDKDYVLFPRKLSSGKTVYYYYIYVDGKKTTPKSTGCGYLRERDKAKTRREAVAYCDRMIESGEIAGHTGLTLSQYVNRKKFWDWKKSHYIRSIIIRSDKDKIGITRGSVDKARQITETHILPHHGKKAIEKITAYDCEQLLFKWVNDGCSNKSANDRKSVYSTILGEYERQLKMQNPKADYFNPWRLVKPLNVSRNPYGSLTIAEVSKIISTDGIDAGNATEYQYYLATKLSFMTGLRIGEVCGLIISDVKDVELSRGGESVRGSYIHVTHRYDRYTKQREIVKGKESRDIPISAQIRDELEPYLQFDGNKYLFSLHPRHETALSANRLRSWLYDRMRSVGIENREQRNIAFHSARRFFNTLLRHAKIADNVIQRFTGHKSNEMTEHYTDYLPEDLPEIERAQLKLLKGEIQE